MHFFNHKIYFKKPKHTDFLIWDYINSGRLKSVIPNSYSISIIGTRPLGIYLHPKIILLSFFLLKDFKLGVCSNNLVGFLKDSLKQLQCIHIKACLVTINPKAVITGIDNCSRFAWLSKNCNSFPFIAIQNGLRLAYDSEDGHPYHVQHLFCFGQKEINDFPKMGYEVDNCYPVGSLLASRKFNMTMQQEPSKNDLLIVSCWRGNIGFSKDVQDSMKTMNIMDNLLAKYLKKSNLKATIMLRSERNGIDWFMPEIGYSEEDYYKLIYDNLVNIVEPNFKERNIYPAMQCSNLIVASFPTTCLIEAFSIGKKVLYTRFGDCDKKYYSDIPKEVIFSSNSNNENDFFNAIDELLLIKKENYISKYQQLMTYYNSFPKNYSTTEEIKIKIKHIIK